MEKITILGSTGSIGRQALSVIAMHPDQFSVDALAANSNVDEMFQQCLQFQPRYAVLVDEKAAAQLAAKLEKTAIKTKVLSGTNALIAIAGDNESDTVIAAIVGAIGLAPTLAAVCAGKKILLANKESLVMAGSVFIEKLRRHHAKLLPVDSEHNAIFQSFPANFQAGYGPAQEVKSIVLTASGGPFYKTPIEQLVDVTPAEAIAHPNWRMGDKISVDSATMMNKGLEVIEAHWLFSLAIEQIEVVIHPQSIIHSAVRYWDGSMVAELGIHDMRTPIACCLAWPKRITSGVADLDLVKLKQLDFAAACQERFPCLRLAYEALRNGGTASAILNAANEVAVAAFLKENLRFTQIAEIIEEVLNRVRIEPADQLETILAADAKAREVANQIISQVGLLA